MLSGVSSGRREAAISRDPVRPKGFQAGSEGRARGRALLLKPEAETCGVERWAGGSRHLWASSGGCRWRREQVGQLGPLRDVWLAVATDSFTGALPWPATSLSQAGGAAVLPSKRE